MSHSKGSDDAAGLSADPTKGLSTDLSSELQARVREAHATKTRLRIVAGGSKAFYGNPVVADVIDVSGHTGIIEYQPSELVVTVRSGTRLATLEAELRENRQMLAFEPPQHSARSTIGGVVACGLSGPRRAACGAARDFVLGTTLINGLGQHCRFGGQVMKNVAGYDASRLMVGAQGTLGLLLDISIKVLPLPEAEVTLKLEMAAVDMPAVVLGWVREGLPVSATCHVGGDLYLRLSSTPSAVRHARAVISRAYACEEISGDFWLQIRDQTHAFFRESRNLWRCSHLPTTPLYGNNGDTGAGQMLEWNGALRWLHSSENLHIAAAQQQGHAQRHPLHANHATDADSRPAEDIFQPLQAGVMKIQQRLKQAFDPAGILNSGRVYAQL